MGRANVALVCARWASLPDRAFRVLVLMANTCYDNTPEPVYYGGREALVHVLGYEPSQSAFRTVARALADLRDAGAIKVVRPGGNGRRAEYALTLERHLVSPNSVPQQGSWVTPSDTLRVTPEASWVTPGDELGDTYCHPKQENHFITPTAAEINSREVTTSPVRGSRCGHCSGGWLAEDSEGRRAPCPSCKPHLRPVPPIAEGA